MLSSIIHFESPFSPDLLPQVMWQLYNIWEHPQCNSACHIWWWLSELVLTHCKGEALYQRNCLDHRSFVPVYATEALLCPRHPSISIQPPSYWDTELSDGDGLGKSSSEMDNKNNLEANLFFWDVLPKRLPGVSCEQLLAVPQCTRDACKFLNLRVNSLGQCGPLLHKQKSADVKDLTWLYFVNYESLVL